MLDTTANPPAGGQPSLAQPVPAQPPSRSEVERKLSFRSATSSSRLNESPKKKKPTHQIPLSGYHLSYSASGNESDSSSITSSSQPLQVIGSPNPTSPLLTPTATSVGGLSAIAERKFGNDIIDEMELEDVEEEEEEEGPENDNDNEGNESASEVEDGGLEGLEGERVVKSGYLWKKQERRKAWKKRWFVLRTGKLAYYKDEKEYSLKKVIDLHQVHTVAPVTVKKHPHSFGIVVPKRTFFAKASSQDDMEEWVRAINGVRRKLSEREEEERSRREKGEHHHYPQHQYHQQQQRTTSVTIPTRERSTGDAIDTTSPTTSSAAGSYFVNRPIIGGSSSSQAIHTAGSVSPSLASGGIIPPSSPLDTTNSLTSQVAKLNISTPRTPSAPPISSQPVSYGMPGSRVPSTSTSVPPSRSVSTKREPSASSIGSSTAATQGNLNERPITLNLQNSASGMGSNQFIPSSEDEDDLDQVESNQGGQGGQYQNQAQSLPSTPMDPTKVILSAYLTKRSKGRGRKVWRKRWFVLTSQGVTYSKSHMDTKALRFIPLTSILDALEVDASDQSSESETDQIPNAHPHNHNPFHPHGHQHTHPSHHQQGLGHSPSMSISPPQKQYFTTAMRGRLSSNDHNTQQQLSSSISSATPKNSFSQQSASAAGSSDKNGINGGHGDENVFRLITAKRTYVLCAPSEEDEIKWLAATRALLNQLRINNQQQQQPTSPVNITSGQMQLPTITQQPPTPAASLSESQSQSRSQSQSQPLSVKRTNSRSISQSGSGITLEKELPQYPMPNIQRQNSNSPSPSPSTPPTPGSGSVTRGRSATYMAKSAVADVVKKFHPES
ncbi:uncharacterized protein L201_003788 [Kwoniella dendrophila CBS 6074]|uniref:PH domain-containing protein n=1 Tax=Kwoniella dendrophila CBS 6074 TaxID=1295534 RepID=A0AAX4JWF5_9TREE